MFSTVPVFTWDSQVRDGYKRCLTAPSPEKGTGARAAWRGQEEHSTVQELLRDSLDKAYGKQGKAWCLSWGTWHRPSLSSCLQ